MSLRFANPWILLLAILIPTLLVIRYYLSSRQTKPGTLTYAATRLAKSLGSTWRVTWRPILVAMRLVAIGLIFMALARPQIVHGRETIKGEGVEIALALDISGSMASLDFQPDNRLEAAKKVIGEFIDERPYDKIGLVIFSNEAFNQSPLTLDHRMLTRALGQVELATELGIDDGTAIGLGIANAANMLADSDAESRVIVLLTDGVNNAGQIDPLTAAEAAKALDIKVYTIGAAKPGRVPVPVQSFLGGTQLTYQESVLDEETLQQVSELTGGKYFRAEDTEGLEAIYEEINNLEKSQIEIQVFNQYQELAVLFLLPALLILVVETALRNTAFVKVP